MKTSSELANTATPLKLDECGTMFVDKTPFLHGGDDGSVYFYNEERTDRELMVVLWNEFQDRRDEPLDIGYPCEFFIPPNADRRTEAVTNMRQEDFDWFTEHDVRLSAESTTLGYVFYADVGVKEADDTTPREACIVCHNTSDPFEAFHTLRQRAEKLLAISDTQLIRMMAVAFDTIMRGDQMIDDELLIGMKAVLEVVRGTDAL